MFPDFLDEDGLSEEEAWEIALRDHPEYRKAIEKGTLPDEITDEHGNVMSPRAHLAIHVSVERQIAADTPDGIASIAQDLERCGVSHHEVRHLIGEPLAAQMWYMTKEGCPFDERRYLAELHETVARFQSRS